MENASTPRSLKPAFPTETPTTLYHLFYYIIKTVVQEVHRSAISQRWHPYAMLNLSH